jgi:hypothetical protein
VTSSRTFPRAPTACSAMRERRSSYASVITACWPGWSSGSNGMCRATPHTAFGEEHAPIDSELAQAEDSRPLIRLNDQYQVRQRFRRTARIDDLLFHLHYPRLVVKHSIHAILRPRGNVRRCRRRHLWGAADGVGELSL